MIFLKRSLCLILLTAVLGGCGNDKEATVGLGGIKKSLKDIATVRKQQATPAPAVTRAALSAFKTPMIMADVPAIGLTTFLVPVAQNGAVETWGTVDDKTISFRQGVMIATRGFGPDIMQATAPTAAQLAVGSGKYSRVYYYLDGADQTLRREYACSLASLGAETITVVDRQHLTRHVTETCTGNGGDFVNEYW
ncbi:MAG: YjbF family lipoprotein, partial [Paracoccaceae bacterium]|nr:YjbF family lipoprotein [Paracoccaceae bacterium]